jgi:hypothetical protein
MAQKRRFFTDMPLRAFDPTPVFPEAPDAHDVARHHLLHALCGSVAQLLVQPRRERQPLTVLLAGDARRLHRRFLAPTQRKNATLF